MYGERSQNWMREISRLAFVRCCENLLQKQLQRKTTDKKRTETRTLHGISPNPVSDAPYILFSWSREREDRKRALSFTPSLSVTWQDITLRKWGEYSTSNESGERDPQDTEAVLKSQESQAQLHHINVPQDQTPISPLSLCCYPSSMFGQPLYHPSGCHWYPGGLIAAILGY